MKSEKTVVFSKIFFLGLFFSVLFLSFFRNLFSSLGGIEFFIPLFGIPVFFITAFVAAMILIPRKFKLDIRSDAVFNFTALLFSVYGLVFLFLSFFLLHRFLLRIFFVPESFRDSILLLAVFILACGYMTGIVMGISFKKIKTQEQYEYGSNGFAAGFGAGCALILVFIFFKAEWLVFLPSVSGFFFLASCFIPGSERFLHAAVFFALSSIFCLFSFLFIFFNEKDFFPYSMESFSGKYEFKQSGISFNGKYEPFQPEMDHMLLLSAGLQNQKCGKKILILSNENISSAYSAKLMPFIEDTEILTSSPEFSGLLHSAHLKVKTHVEDPFSFLKKSSERYDIVFLCDANYGSLAFQKFYSLEMFRAIRENMDPGGVFAIRLPLRKNMDTDRILASTVSKVFPHVLMIDGKNRFLLASDHELTLSPEILDKRMESFVSGKKSSLPLNLFSLVGSFIQKDSSVIDGNKMSSEDILTKENPLLLYAVWKNMPIFKEHKILTVICRSVNRHLTVILLISAVLYILIRYFMTDHLERKMLFRSIELGIFTFGAFTFFSLLFQLRTSHLYFMMPVLAGFFAGASFGKKGRSSGVCAFLSGILPFAVYWIRPDQTSWTWIVFIAGIFFLGYCFRNGSDSCCGKCEDSRWRSFIPVAALFGGAVGMLLVCIILSHYGMMHCMIFLFLLVLPGMIRHS